MPGLTGSAGSFTGCHHAGTVGHKQGHLSHQAGEDSHAPAPVLAQKGWQPMQCFHAAF